MKRGIVGIGMGIVALAGCVGTIEDSTAGPTGGGAGDGRNEGVATSAQCAGPELGPSPLTRLSAREYRNTIADIMGDAVEVPSLDALPPDERVGPFDSNAAAPVGEYAVEVYRDLADRLAADAIESVDRLLPCTPAGAADVACARRSIRELGRNLYRRPLDDAEVDGLVEVYDVGAADGSFAAGFQLTLEAMLQSPHFLYRIELGEPAADGTLVELTPHEVASRLSYFLWQTAPGAQLRAAADDGQLQTRQSVVEHARRMLDDPRADRTIRSFFRQWLGLSDLDRMERQQEAYPDYRPAIGAQMQRETDAFVTRVIRSEEPTFATLLTAPFTFTTPEVAQLVYGREVEPSDSDGLVELELDSERRAGLLTQPSVLASTSHAAQTSPVLRGKMVRERLFCDVLPPPPADVDDTAPPVEPDLPTRERFARHRSDPACAGCHELMDPIGYGLEHFDAVGRYRAADGEHPIDARGELKETDVDGKFEGAVELADRLVSSEQVQRCFVDQWVTFALERNPTEGDSCTVRAVRGRFVESGLDLRELLLTLAASKAFRYRRVPDAREMEVDDGEG